MSITILPSMESFGAGFLINRPEKNDMESHYRWYAGDYKTLLPPDDNIATGMALFDNPSVEIMNLPLFQLASDFYENAVLAEMPAATADSPEQLEWVDEHASMIDRALRRATGYWKITDFAVFTAEPNFIRAVDSRFYYRVGEPEQKDVTVGHIIAYPYREVQLDEINAGTFGLIPNRILVTKVLPNGEGSTQQVFAFDGNVVGAPITPAQPSPITAVCVAGAGDTWYDGAKDLAARIIIQASHIEQDINRYRNRPMYAPASVGAAINAALPLAQRGNLTAMQAVLRRTIRAHIPLAPQDEVPLDDYSGVDISAPHEMLLTNLDLFFMTSGLPPSSFGIGVGRGESGVARERAQDAASARARAYRRDLSDCLPMLCAAAGGGDGLGFNWTAPPFQDRTVRTEELLKLLNANVVSADEVRSALGWRGTTIEAGIASEEDAPDTENE